MGNELMMMIIMMCISFEYNLDVLESSLMHDTVSVLVCTTTTKVMIARFMIILGNSTGFGDAIHVLLVFLLLRRRKALLFWGVAVPCRLFFLKDISFRMYLWQDFSL